MVRLRRMVRRSDPVTCLLVLSVALTVLYNECLCYWLARRGWTAPPSMDEEDSVRVLFVADPQLIGYRDVAKPNFVARLDCDRYLRSTFWHAYRFARPEVVVFLGDLLDDGSQSTDEEYRAYYERFESVFPLDDDVKAVYIPGDNDVGGEGFDRKLEWKTSRFQRFFSTKIESLVSHRFLDFLLLNYDIQDSPTAAQLQTLAKYKTTQPGQFLLLLNHMQLSQRSFSKNLSRALDANFVFSAHLHTSRHYMCTECGRGGGEHGLGRLEPHVLEDSRLYHFHLEDRAALHEVAVPSCSYRMGVPRMGYGFASIAKTGDMQYTVLWLPARYTCLFVYLGVLVFVVGTLVLRGLSRLFSRSKHLFNY